jgi:hypothetical protein
LQPYGPPWPVTGISLLSFYFTYKSVEKCKDGRLCHPSAAKENFQICHKLHVASSTCLCATIFQNPEGILWTHCIKIHTSKAFVSSCYSNTTHLTVTWYTISNMWQIINTPLNDKLFRLPASIRKMHKDFPVAYMIYALYIIIYS